jgi:hypothetical protein
MHDAVKRIDQFPFKVDLCRHFRHDSVRPGYNAVAEGSYPNRGWGTDQFLDGIESTCRAWLAVLKDKF